MLNDALRTAAVDGRELDEKDPWGPFLSSDAYAIRSKFHTTLKATPDSWCLEETWYCP
jgi:hypothetical protein